MSAQQLALRRQLLDLTLQLDSPGLALTAILAQRLDLRLQVADARGQLLELDHAHVELALDAARNQRALVELAVQTLELGAGIHELLLAATQRVLGLALGRTRVLQLGTELRE